MIAVLGSIFGAEWLLVAVLLLRWAREGRPDLWTAVLAWAFFFPAGIGPNSLVGSRLVRDNLFPPSA